MATQEALISDIRIKRINELRGPNIWAHQPVLEAHVDIGPYEERPSDKIPGFTDRLFQAIPTLIEHRCSEGHRGGFLVRMQGGTYMGHIIEHVCLELQCLAGMDVAYGKTRSEGDDFPGEYRVVVEYWAAEAGKRSIEIAVEGCEALARGELYAFTPAIEEIRKLGKRGMFKSATRSLLSAARRRGIPWLRLAGRNNLQLGYGKYGVKILDGIISTPKKSKIQIRKGQSEDYYHDILNRLFSKGGHGRIPIVAVTGTHGAPVVAQMLNHILRADGYKAGLAVSDGFYLAGKLFSAGDYSGPEGAEDVLTHSDVAAAVLETSVEGIVRCGLAFDVCDVGVMLNVVAERSDVEGVHSIEDLAYAHGVVIEGVRRNGYGVLNAADPLVADLARYCEGTVLFFSADPANSVLRGHLDDGGGIGVTVIDGWLSLCEGKLVRRVVKVKDIQTLKLEDALAAAAAAWGAGVRPKVIARALRDL